MASWVATLRFDVQRLFENELDVVATLSTTPELGEEDDVNTVNIRVGGQRIQLRERTAEKIFPSDEVSAVFGNDDARGLVEGPIESVDLGLAQRRPLGTGCCRNPIGKGPTVTGSGSRRLNCISGEPLGLTETVKVRVNERGTLPLHLPSGGTSGWPDSLSSVENRDLRISSDSAAGPVRQPDLGPLANGLPGGARSGEPGRRGGRPGGPRPLGHRRRGRVIAGAGGESALAAVSGNA